MHKTFPEAMRAFRRGSHVYGNNWACIALCEDSTQLGAAYEEALNITSVSSASVAEVDRENRTFETGKGARIRFSIGDTLSQTQLHLNGFLFTHIIWMFPPDDSAMNFVETLKRSETIAPEDMPTMISILD